MNISERKGNIMTKKKKYGKVQVKNFKWIYAFLLPTIIIFVMFYVQPRDRFKFCVNVKN